MRPGGPSAGTIHITTDLLVAFVCRICASIHRPRKTSATAKGTAGRSRTSSRTSGSDGSEGTLASLRRVLVRARAARVAGTATDHLFAGADRQSSGTIALRKRAGVLCTTWPGGHLRCRSPRGATVAFSTVSADGAGGLAPGPGPTGSGAIPAHWAVHACGSGRLLHYPGDAIRSNGDVRLRWRQCLARLPVPVGAGALRGGMEPGRSLAREGSGRRALLATSPVRLSTNSAVRDDGAVQDRLDLVVPRWLSRPLSGTQPARTGALAGRLGGVGLSVDADRDIRFRMVGDLVFPGAAEHVPAAGFRYPTASAMASALAGPVGPAAGVHVCWRALPRLPDGAV